MAEEEFCWSRACVEREEQIKLWDNNGSNLRTLALRRHIACVDALHLFQVPTMYLGVTGARSTSGFKLL